MNVGINQFFGAWDWSVREEKKGSWRVGDLAILSRSGHARVVVDTPPANTVTRRSRGGDHYI